MTRRNVLIEEEAGTGWRRVCVSSAPSFVKNNAEARDAKRWLRGARRGARRVFGGGAATAYRLTVTGRRADCR